MENKTLNLCIDRCSKHDFYAISIGDDDTGTRLTPSKCCGSWSTLRSWRFNQEQLQRLVNDIQSEIDYMKKNDQ